MPEINLDNPGDIRWFAGHAPAPVLGPCPHLCRSTSREPHAHHVIAWGPTTERYELVECLGVSPPTECAGRCRAWRDGWGNIVTGWLMVDVDPAYRLSIVRHTHGMNPQRLVDGACEGSQAMRADR